MATEAGGGAVVFKAGDAVKHGPTGESWLLAAVEGDAVYPAGWPCTRADAADCTLIEACTEEKSLAMLRRVAEHCGEGSDPRYSIARSQLHRRDLAAIGVDPGKLVRKPRIVCLCGSTRFIDRMAIEAWELEKAGAVVLSCHLLPASYGAAAAHQAEVEGVAEALDYLHLAKIDMADVVRVVNPGGYIGASTAREISYALLIGKPVEFLEAPACAEGGGAC